jgi:chromosome segregation ATPase
MKPWGKAAALFWLLALGWFQAWAQNQETPKEVLSPKLYDQLQGKLDPISVELREMRSDLNHFGNQHNDILMEIRELKVHAEDMQNEVNQERRRIDSMDPTKAAERLRALEDFVSDQKKQAQDQAAVSQKRWDNIMDWLRVVASLAGGLVANESRKLLVGWWQKRKAQKRLDSQRGLG